MKKKAQMGVEFLMTYGWAILVVLIVMSAFFYFDVFNAQSLLPERCEFQSGLYCKEYRIDSATNLIDLRIVNTREESRITEIKAVGEGPAADIECLWSGTVNLKTAESTDFQLGGASCNLNTLTTTKYRFDFLVTYYKQGEPIQHTTSGILFARRE